MNFVNAGIYEGEWKNNQISGDISKGEWLNSKLNGKAKFIDTYKGKQTYKGLWKENIFMSGTLSTENEIFNIKSREDGLPDLSKTSIEYICMKMEE